MTGENWPRVLFFCLATGAGLGALYAVFSGVRVLLRAGKGLTAVLDILFCLICGTVVFLCALAVDKGRLRFYQAALQLLGGWSAAAVLTPALCGLAGLWQKIFCRFTGFLQEKFSILRARLRPKQKKPTKKRKKPGKNLKKAKKRA